MRINTLCRESKGGRVQVFSESFRRRKKAIAFSTIGELGNKMLNVVMLTTESSPAMKERGKAAGVRGWIVKPFKGDAVLATFKTLAA